MQSRQLHLANIANVAYGYARALRQAGREADVLCYDLNHVLSLPEWADGDFEIVIENEWAPDFDHPELKRMRPPEWYRRIRSQDHWVTGAVADPARRVNAEWVDSLVRASQRYGPRWAFTAKDVLAYVPLADALSVRFFGDYDVIFGYAYGAVPPLLASLEPYVPVEIGTLRDTVNEDTPLGRLLALAYRSAPHTIITNADCLSAAHALGMERFSYVPHPVDEDVFRPFTPAEKLEFRRGLCDTRHLLIAPARQFWSVKANDRYLRAFAELVRGGEDATLMISDWGPDVARARQMIADMGIGERVKWFHPAPEVRLAKLFAAADLVLDQFGSFGTFGLIGPKAMSCGTPCLLSFDPKLHEWCFDETPPAVPAREEEEILAAMRHYLGDEAARVALGARCREWILAHHSKPVVVEKMDRIVAAIAEGRAAGSGFDALRAQKRALFAVPAAAPAQGAGADAVVAAQSPGIGRRLRHYASRLKGIAQALRVLPRDRERLLEVEEALRHERATREAMERQLAGMQAGLQDQVQAQADRLQGHVDKLQAQADQLQTQADQLQTHALQLRTQESQLQLHASLAQQNVLNVLDVMGRNRLEDREFLTQARTGMLEDLVRARMIGPLQVNGVRQVAPARPRDPISVEEAFRRLEQAAPLNWPLFVRALNQGTESYETLPAGSCSTEAHPQAQLFRAFLRHYLRGNVLDVGCGPQPVPYYLADYPVEHICGIDPISKPEDHPFQFVPGVGEFLPWEDDSFDVVVSGTTLDHYYLLDRGLEQALRVLRPGGHFVAWITEFKDAPPYDPYAARMDAPYDEEHLFHIDRAWFIPYMRGLGFREVEVLHFELPFNYLFMSFEKPA